MEVSTALRDVTAPSSAPPAHKLSVHSNCDGHATLELQIKKQELAPNTREMQTNMAPEEIKG